MANAGAGVARPEISTIITSTRPLDMAAGFAQAHIDWRNLAAAFPADEGAGYYEEDTIEEESQFRQDLTSQIKLSAKRILFPLAEAGVEPTPQTRHLLANRFMDPTMAGSSPTEGVKNLGDFIATIIPTYFNQKEITEQIKIDTLKAFQDYKLESETEQTKRAAATSPMYRSFHEGKALKHDHDLSKMFAPDYSLHKEMGPCLEGKTVVNINLELSDYNKDAEEAQATVEASAASTLSASECALTFSESHFSSQHPPLIAAGGAGTEGGAKLTVDTTLSSLTIKKLQQGGGTAPLATSPGCFWGRRKYRVQDSSSPHPSSSPSPAHDSGGKST